MEKFPHGWHECFAGDYLVTAILQGPFPHPHLMLMRTNTCGLTCFSPIQQVVHILSVVMQLLFSL